MDRSYSFRIYPNETQRILIARTFGVCRHVYNRFVEMSRGCEEAPDFYGLQSRWLSMKRETDWMREPDKFAPVNAIRDMVKAFRDHRRNPRHFGEPGYRSRHDRHQSYRTNSCNNNIEVGDRYIKLPKLGRVACRVSRQVEGRILNATVSRRPSGKYFVSICCTDCKVDALPRTGKAVGIDLGIRNAVALSDGTIVKNPKNLRDSRRKLAHLQRSLARKRKGSHNREKARLKVARLQEHIANRRGDWMHKLTTMLVRAYDDIHIEDLDVRSMLKNRKVSRHEADVAWGEFRRQLTYKCEWYGRTLTVIDRSHPSSQTCSNCGYVNADLKLGQRRWVCPKCEAKHDRDVNAAINILRWEPPERSVV